MSDLLVAGGGPAGLATALVAARHGLTVTVWEPRAGTIDKACGEGLMPGAVAALRDLDVDPAGHDLAGIRYLRAGRAAEAPFRTGPGRGVRRTVLHDALRSAALARGVAFEQAAVEELTQDGSGVEVRGNGRTARASYVVAADGLHSPLRRRLGLEAAPARRRRYGLRAHYEVTPWTDLVEVHWARDAEAYVTPVGRGLVGVAVLSAVRAGFDEHLAAFPELGGRLAGTPHGAVRGAGPLRQRATARVAGRVLLVGDAAGYVDALTGEGVALAVAQARAAVLALAEDDPDRYERDWHRVTRRYRWLTSSLLEATRVPPVRRLLVPAAQRLPWVFDQAVGALARPA